ncbi:hypothetical protein [Vibrio coralliilyticus]|uniref:Uncharacterized protein n=1 Tax=Vibrio coralliilyticus TaxID=190893 RepID=A0AAP6ZUD2_9VIBR|nr:hypothetical protein [Vibrio coralliilyticus]NOI32001.1 hypothetical protein [Vibrio coralliilyticus]NOJ25202.1 hypothetical protein [Vibrio coralliilyticus]
MWVSMIFFYVMFLVVAQKKGKIVNIKKLDLPEGNNSSSTKLSMLHKKDERYQQVERHRRRNEWFE